MYAAFDHDPSGVFGGGRWTVRDQAPRSKRLGQSPGAETSGRRVATTSPVREPKWLDETDEEDEYLFDDYYQVSTPAPVRAPRRGGRRPVPGTRAVRSAGNAAKTCAIGFRRLTSRAARGLVGALNDRSSVFDFKMFKFFTFVLNVTLSTFEIPRQLILIPLIMASRLRFVPDWVLAAFDYLPEEKKLEEKKERPEFKFPKLRWNALKTWENAMQAGRESLRRAESQQNVTEKPEVGELFSKLMVEAKAYDSACDSAKAQAAFEQALKLRPDDPEALCGLSKELSDRVFDHEIFHNKVLARQFATEASDHAARAMELAPASADAYIAYAVANARLSMFSEARQKVELTHSIKGNLLKALELDPNNDYAYHVLARFEHTMAHIGGLTRYLIKKIYGAIEPATIEKAEEYFRRAIEINPKRLIHGVELAKLLYETKCYDECKELLERSLDMEIEDINSQRTKLDGEALLRKLTHKMTRTPSRGILSRTPSKRSMPRTSSSLSTPPLARSESKGSGLFSP